jgi:hypothetical protein
LVNRIWYIFSGIGLIGGLCKFYANAGGKKQIKRQLLSAIQAASQSTFTKQQFTPLVISRNDKKKTANSIKPTQTGINRNK